MSIVDQIKSVVSVDESDVNRAERIRSQLQELNDVETALDSIGIKLEPVFDISLTARIGSNPKSRL